MPPPFIALGNMARSKKKQPPLAQRARMRIPASTSNLGAGFDCLGLALSLYNVFTLEPNGGTAVTVSCKGLDENAESLIGAGRNNLVWRSANEVFRRVGVKPRGMKIKMEIAVPLARGLGSSATAIIAGVTGANALLGSPLSQEAVFDLVTTLEGHPDNAAAAFHGGLTAAVVVDGVSHVSRYRACPDLRAVVAIPPHPLSTQKARAALPKEVAHSDAVHNLSRMPFLIKALTTGAVEDLHWAMDDKLHVPYRLPLSRNGRAIGKAALSAGAAAITISGAGPSLIAFCLEPQAATVAKAMAKLVNGGDVRVLKVDNKGVRLTVKEGVRGVRG